MYQESCGLTSLTCSRPWIPVVCLQCATAKLVDLEQWKEKLQSEAHTLIDFFCEDKETMTLDECLQIFRDFCTKFNKAVKVRPGGFLKLASPVEI